MAVSFLDFEQPIAELEAKIEELKFLGSDAGVKINEEVKKLKDAMTDFEKAGRQDLLAQASSEVALLAQFLPAQLSEADVSAAVAKKASELGLSGEAAYGRLMGEVMKDLKGKTDGAAVGKAVKAFLQNT